jgi:hypothetical protein
MGAACSQDGGGDYPTATRSTSQGSGGGHRLGGDGDAQAAGLSAREAAARAAEARATGGPAAAAAERRTREDLIAKIMEAYAKRGKDAPIGIGSLPTARLKELWAGMR